MPLIAAGIALAVVALVARQAHAQEPSAPGPQAFKPEFSSGACPEHLEVPHDAVLTCGYVTVLEDRARPDGRVIELYVVRIRALSPIKYHDPVIYLAGGPGGSAVRQAQRFLDRGRHLWTGRYLVLFDQRGIGGSRPRLECAQYRHDYADIRDRDLDPDEELEWRVEALLGCKRKLTESGIDLGTYTSAATAADVADIASAMEFESFNLYGSSYGTLLALNVMRDFPAGVRSVILDGVLPFQTRYYETYYAEWAAAVGRFFRHCEAAPVCSRQYPDLEETFWRAVDRYTADPFTLEYYDRYADKLFEEEFDGDFVAALLATSLRNERLIPYLPFLVREIAAGNDFVADAWARPGFRDDGEPIDNTAAWASMVCYSSYGSFLDRTKIAADRAAHTRYVDPDSRSLPPALCDRWNDRPTDTVENEAVASDIPTLLLSGQFDPTTPPKWADIAAETLSNSYSYVVPMAGHGVGIDTPCGQKLVRDFLHRPDQGPGSPCLASDHPQFSDIYLNRGPRTMDTRGWGSGSSLRSTLFPVYAVAMASWMIQVAATTSWLTQPVATASWLIQGVAGVPAPTVWPLSVLTVWPLSVLTVWPIIFVVSRRRQVPSSTNRLAGPARVIAGAALLIIAGFILWVHPSGDTDVVRNFGYHPPMRQWFVIPYVTAPIAVLVLYLAYRAWRERWWSLLGRVHYSLVALSIVWSLAYLRIWGFIGP